VTTEPHADPTDLDPRTPVLVGVGQVSELLGRPGYQQRSPVELAADAARAAIADAGVDPARVAAAIDTVAGVRQFEISTPMARPLLGASDNYPRSVAQRVGAAPRRAVLEVVGGQNPQHLVNEFSAAIAAGTADTVLLFGSEAISTAEALAGSEERPDWSEHVEGDLEDRGYGLAGLMSMHEANHGLVDAPSQYALFENARRARLKLTREEYAAEIGALFAPFTRVAAANPLSAAPTERSAAELTTPTERNRPIADPYARFVVAREKVNQGAAVLLTSVATARRLGIDPATWVFLHGHADLRERNLLEREDLSASPAARLASAHALEAAGVGTDEVATFDFYSCFPVAVFNAAVDGLGLSPDDPRGLTLTGGLPFFGGAGNNYSMHAIAETVARLRENPGTFGFVGANGGSMSKYSVGVYSTTPAPWHGDDSARLQAEIDAWPAPEQARHADGWASIETYTVTHRRSGRTGIVVGRLESDGRRFISRTVDGDEQTLALLNSPEPIGQRIFVGSFGVGNRVATSPEHLDELLPPRPKVLRDDYEHVLVRRDGHLLEVTIDRPDKRNSLTPAANEELAEVFDAYFADPDLWVAILTGAGDKAFSAGNDLVYSASGQPMWTPKTGFGGLTSRRGMKKPVIAAVNGFAMGGGFEIALACHLVVADEAAQFALSEVRVGLVAGAGGLVRLPRAIPLKVATEMILTGRRIGADEARQLGVVNRVVAPGTALEGARALAAEILAGSPTSVRVSLAVMAETEGVADTLDAVTAPSAHLDELMVSQDAVEGMTAFAQKRSPQWRNR